MKRMLINATHSEEIRVALADGQKLYNLDIDVPGQDRKKGNIYKGRITRVEPSLEAAFVDYGADRHGFLPYKEISRNYYTEAANKAKERPSIAKAIKEGTEVIIQVNKEERGNKGAAISTYISLAGRYLVYMPENPKAGGISRRIEGQARQELKTSLNKITQPKDSGIIVRTAGIGRTAEELNWDLNYLDQVWTAIKSAAAVRKAPFFLYQESDIFIRALRDYLRPDVGEILIDDKETYEKARDFMQQVMPHNLKKLSYYNDNIPLFSRYQIESQIQSAFSREVRLPSGGSLVIDHTEAMISIDINSARATKGADIEETALNTNLEAADEIARQLRIRDLGGLIVIDFIDMRNHKNQRSVEQQLDEAISNDRARVQTSKISRFGLLEMSRQRLKSSINESSQFACPRCSGHGFIRNIESLSVSIIRILEEEALKPETGKVILQVPTKVANFIINEKREELNGLEARHSVPILIIANEHYQSPQFDVKRLKKTEAEDIDLNNIALNRPENEETAENKSSNATVAKREYAAVDVITPDSQAPTRNSETSIISWMKNLFTAKPEKQQAKAQSKKPAAKQTRQSNTRQSRNTQNSAKKSQYNKPHNKQHNKKGKQPKAKTPGNKAQTNKVQSQKQQTQKQQAQKQQANKTQKHKSPAHPQNKQNQNKAQDNKQKQNKPQDNKQKQATHGKAAPVNKQDTGTVADTQKNKEQILQRPLGSVASYAAQKAKQPTPAVTDKSNVAATESKTTAQKSNKATATKTTDNKNTAVESKVVESSKANSKESNKPASQDKQHDKTQKPVQAEQSKTQAKDVEKKPETATKTKQAVKATDNKSADKATDKKDTDIKVSSSKAEETKATAKNINKDTKIKVSTAKPENKKPTPEKASETSAKAESKSNKKETQKPVAVKTETAKKETATKVDATSKTAAKTDSKKPSAAASKKEAKKPAAKKETKSAVTKAEQASTKESKPAVNKEPVKPAKKKETSKAVEKTETAKKEPVKTAAKPEPKKKPQAAAVPKKTKPILPSQQSIDFDI
jgi:ribonuclease E